MQSDERSLLLDTFRAALAAVNGRACVARTLAGSAPLAPVHAVAVGKAAAAMMLGALDVWGSAIQQGLVVTKHGHGMLGDPFDERVQLIEAGHPLPDEGSLEAGRALLSFVNAAPADAQFLFLISGGSSSLVEVLPEGVDLTQWRQANDWLLASGLDIAHMNAVRKALSCVKGGRLALRLGGHRTLGLLISDVRGDDPATIGSGLLAASDAMPALDGSALPDWLRALTAAAPALPTPMQLASLDLTLEIVARLEDAVQAVAAAARAAGQPATVHTEFVDGDAAEVGARLAERLLVEVPGVHVWGGETTVRLPTAPGRGGRSQHLALSAAQVLRGHRDVALLAVGTDGTDGPGGDAGALVDGGTVARGEAEGFDARDCLARADSGSFLQASGDLIHTGPTGTNVMDLIIGLKRG